MVDFGREKFLKNLCFEQKFARKLFGRFFCIKIQKKLRLFCKVDFQVIKSKFDPCVLDLPNTYHEEDKDNPKRMRLCRAVTESGLISCLYVNRTYSDLPRFRFKIVF